MIKHLNPNIDPLKFVIEDIKEPLEYSKYHLNILDYQIVS